MTKHTIRMVAGMTFMLIVFAAIAAGVVVFRRYEDSAGMKAMAASFGPPTVSTVKAGYQEWQPEMKAVGSLRAVNGADLSSELAGIVQSISFESGTDVDKDAVLVQLRDDDDIAKLHALEANAKLAGINYQRDLKQIKAQAISQASVDADAAALASDEAQVVEQQAIIDKKTIRAPFAGHLGIRQVDIGQYLNPGTAIVTLQQLDPIYVDFTLPEQALPKIAPEQKIALTTDVSGDKPFVGIVTAVNSKVDESTRNVYVRAAVSNPDHKLLPGMFGTVTIDVEKPVKYITLPQTAILFNTYGNTVYLVQKKGDDEPQLTVQQSVVITGATRGDQIAVLSGIKEGEEVVTSGQVKLHNGATVLVDNTVQPSSDADPAPHEH